MAYVDVHSHYEEIPESELEKFGFIILNGMDKETNQSYLSRTNENIKAALGFHPLSITDEQSYDQGLTELKRISEIKNDNFVAIGEIGDVDYYHCKDEVLQGHQKDVFKNALLLAQKLEKPVLIHARNSAQDVLDIIDGLQLEGNYHQKTILHCFEASKKNIERAIEMGCYFTIPASVGRNEMFQRLVELVPLDKMLTETDAPYQGLRKE